jgi:hypothetical protein
MLSRDTGRPFASLRVTTEGKVEPCHAEPIRFAQGKLREASRCPSSQTLRGVYPEERRAQGDNFPGYRESQRKGR